jgi:hypothetical protein
MRPEAVKLGPFTGGMNTASDPSAILDNELVDCKNFELDLDGSLVSRPAIVETVNDSGSWTERIVIIGRAILAGGKYIIGSNSNGTYAFDGTTWTLIQANLQSRIALQYADHVYIVAQTGSAINGGRWDGAAFTVDPNMPKVEAAVFHKSRLFIIPGILATGTSAHHLRFTDPIATGTVDLSGLWTASNLIPVGQGDGQKLIDLVVHNDNLLIFKQDSTYVYAYDIRPSEGIIRKISNDIGVTSRRCAVTYENSVFIYHEGNVYEILNNDFKRVNMRVPFQLDSSVPLGTTRAEEVFLCLFGDRLLVRYYNRIYVFGLLTRTWSRWESASSTLHNIGPLEEFPSLPTESTLTKYYAGSSLLNHEKVFVMSDGHDASVERTLSPTTDYDITCSALTKNFDAGDSHHFKKLAWWGADVLSARTIIGVASPVVINFQIKWQDLHAFTWGQMHAFTWGQPSTSLAVVVTTEVDDVLTLGRKFVKFLKALRWRQINFRVTLITSGGTSDGPCRLFSLTALIGSKQQVVKQVS